MPEASSQSSAEPQRRSVAGVVCPVVFKPAFRFEFRYTLRIVVGELGVGVLGCFTPERGGDVDGGELYALADKLTRPVRMRSCLAIWYWGGCRVKHLQT